MIIKQKNSTYIIPPHDIYRVAQNLVNEAKKQGCVSFIMKGKDPKGRTGEYAVSIRKEYDFAFTLRRLRRLLLKTKHKQR